MEIASGIFEIEVREGQFRLVSVLNIDRTAVGGGETDGELHEIFPFPVPGAPGVVAGEPSEERQGRRQQARQIVEVKKIVFHAVI